MVQITRFEDNLFLFVFLFCFVCNRPFFAVDLVYDSLCYFFVFGILGNHYFHIRHKDTLFPHPGHIFSNFWPALIPHST